MREYRQFRDESDLEPEAGDGEARRAYISEIIGIAAGDARNLVVMATVAVGIVLFLIKDSVNSIVQLGVPFPQLAGIGTALLLISAGLEFWYAAQINRRRMSMARCLATSDAKKARDLWAGDEHGIRAERGWILNFAMASMGLGLLFAAVVVAGLLLA